MSFLKICFYPDGSSGPVKDFLTDLAADRPATYIKLALDLEVLGAEGPRSKQIRVRPLGNGLWELKRLFEGIQYRIFFCVEEDCWLLHSIEKKSAKTPKHDLDLARKRMRRIVS